MIKPTELLRDLFMSWARFRNVRVTISGDSSSFTERDAVYFQLQGIGEILYC